LIRQGYTLEDAGFELEARAAAAGHSRSNAADIILGAPPRHNNVDPALDGR
jgi:hypothetical protein